MVGVESNAMTLKQWAALLWDIGPALSIGVVLLTVSLTLLLNAKAVMATLACLLVFGASLMMTGILIDWASDISGLSKLKTSTYGRFILYCIDAACIVVILGLLACVVIIQMNLS